MHLFACPLYRKKMHLFACPLYAPQQAMCVIADQSERGSA